MAWQRIWEYSSKPGPLSIAVLGDRAILTDGVADPPLVFSGGLAETHEDWAYPKNVISTQDGNMFYDVSHLVLDQDLDAAADIGGIRMNGYVAVCVDVPLVDGFYVEMATPNSGLGATQRLFAISSELSEAGGVAVEDLRVKIDKWVQNATGGHFEGVAKPITGSPVNAGSGMVTLTCAAHGLPANTWISVSGTTNYNFANKKIESVTGDTITISAAYVTETFVAGAQIRERLSIGTGYPDSLVDVGCLVCISGIETTIKAKVGGGGADNAVTLFEQQPSGSVSYIYGLKVTDGDISPNFDAAQSGASFDAAGLTYVGGSSFEGSSIRFVVPARHLSLSGDYVRLTFAAATEDPEPTYVSSGFTAKA